MLLASHLIIILKLNSLINYHNHLPDFITNETLNPSSSALIPNVSALHT